MTAMDVMEKGADLSLVLKNARMQGFAAALAELIRLHDSEPEMVNDMVRSVIDEVGITLAHFRNVGIDDYDLDVIKDLYRL